MAESEWDWSDYREESRAAAEEEEEFTPVEFDPLLELASELVICSMAVEEGRGGWCDDCTCQLKYHVTCDNGECELCGCYDQHKRPYAPLTYIPIQDNYRGVEGATLLIHAMDDVIETYERAEEARKVLKELTE